MFSVDPVLNLAIVKLTEAGSYPITGTERGRGVRPGDRVLAISGWGSGDSGAFALGYVTAREKKSIYSGGFGDMLINARIRLTPNAYGGPLANDKGEVLGILTQNVHLASTQAEDPEGVHALPMNIALGFFRVSRAYPTSQQKWIGLSVRPPTRTKRLRPTRPWGRPQGCTSISSGATVPPPKPTSILGMSCSR